MSYLQIYAAFGALWGWAFVMAASDTSIAGAIATWYWTRDKKVRALLGALAWRCGEKPRPRESPS